MNEGVASVIANAWRPDPTKAWSSPQDAVAKEREASAIRAWLRRMVIVRARSIPLVSLRIPRVFRGGLWGRRATPRVRLPRLRCGQLGEPEVHRTLLVGRYHRRERAIGFAEDEQCENRVRVCV